VRLIKEDGAMSELRSVSGGNERYIINDLAKTPEARTLICSKEGTVFDIFATL
jgi:hypothetical protein